MQQSLQPNLVPNEPSLEYYSYPTLPGTKFEYARKQLALAASAAEVSLELGLSEEAEAELVRALLTSDTPTQAVLLGMYSKIAEWHSNDTKAPVVPEEVPVAPPPEGQENIGAEASQKVPQVTSHSQSVKKQRKAAPRPVEDTSTPMKLVRLPDPRGKVPAAFEPQKPKYQPVKKRERPVPERVPNILLEDGYSLPNTPLALRRLRRRIEEMETKYDSFEQEDALLVRPIVDIYNQIPSEDGITGSELAKPLKALKETCYNILHARFDGIIRSMARKAEKVSGDFDDLMSTAYKDLVRSIQWFDPAYENTFFAYARMNIAGGLRRYYRDKTMETSLHNRRSWEKIGYIRTMVNDGFTMQEIAVSMGVAVSEVQKMLDYGKVYGNFDSLEAISTSRDGQERDITIDSRPNPEQATTESILNEDLQFAFAKAFPNEKELEALKLLRGVVRDKNGVYYFSPFELGMSQAEVAVMMGISQVHVGRLVNSVIKRVQNILGIGAAEVEKALDA